MSSHEDRLLFQSSLLAFGETRVLGDSEEWRGPCETAPHKIITFPRKRFGVESVHGPFVLHAGLAVLPRPSVPYKRVLLDSQGELTNWLWLNPSLGEDVFAREYDRWGRSRWIFQLSGADYLRLEKLGAGSAREPLRDDLQWEGELLSIVLNLGGQVLDGRWDRSCSGPRARVAAFQAIEFMSTELGSDITLTRVAAAVGLTPSHLCVLFKRATGMTMGRYLQRLRLCQAVDCLRERGSDLTSLALELGFSSHSHFTARFRREFGMTPSAARRFVRPEPGACGS